MEIKYKKSGERLTVKLSGELDHNSTSKVKAKIDEILKKDRIRYLDFDMKSVSFMDSSGIGFILGRYRKIKKINGEVKVLNMNTRVRKLFLLAGLNEVIKTK